MRKLIYGMNLTLDGYIVAPGDDIGWSAPSDELFQFWSDQLQATDLTFYGRKLWQTMSSYWPTGDQQPHANPAEIEFARRWRDMSKVVFSSTIDKVDWNTRLVSGDAVAEITRLKAEDGGPMDIGGATLAEAAMRGTEQLPAASRLDGCFLSPSWHFLSRREPPSPKKGVRLDRQVMSRLIRSCRGEAADLRGDRFDRDSMGATTRRREDAWAVRLVRLVDHSDGDAA